jgi:hypothetical protein
MLKEPKGTIFNDLESPLGKFQNPSDISSSTIRLQNDLEDIFSGNAGTTFSDAGFRVQCQRGK